MKIISTLNLTLIACASLLLLRGQADAMAMQQSAGGASAAGGQQQANAPECGVWDQGEAPSDEVGVGVGFGATAAEAEMMAMVQARIALDAAVADDVAAGVNCPTAEDCPRPRFTGCDPDGWYDGISDVITGARSWPLPGGGFQAVGTASLVPGTQVEIGCDDCLIAVQPV